MTVNEEIELEEFFKRNNFNKPIGENNTIYADKLRAHGIRFIDIVEKNIEDSDLIIVLPKAFLRRRFFKAQDRIHEEFKNRSCTLGVGVEKVESTVSHVGKKGKSFVGKNSKLNVVKLKV